jgi:hypothetical protein
MVHEMEETRYLVPTGDGKSQIIIELEEIGRAECRLNDVAIVNQHSAPEMLATFNDCWLKLAKSIAILTCERNKAENAHRQSRAVAKLSCTDDAIKAKGHSKASADLREAMVELDSEVIQTKERLDEISVVHDMLKCKQQAFYNAYGAVKRLLDNRFLPESHVGDANRPKPYSAPPPSIQSAPVDPDFEPLPQGFTVPRR